MADVLTPVERARFDQQWAEINSRLDAFLESQRRCSDAAKVVGQFEVFISGAILAIGREVEHDALAELFEAALARIVDLERKLSRRTED